MTQITISGKFLRKHSLKDGCSAYFMRKSVMFHVEKKLQNNSVEGQKLEECCTISQIELNPALTKRRFLD